MFAVPSESRKPRSQNNFSLAPSFEGVAKAFHSRGVYETQSVSLGSRFRFATGEWNKCSS